MNNNRIKLDNLIANNIHLLPLHTGIYFEKIDINKVFKTICSSLMTTLLNMNTKSDKRYEEKKYASGKTT